MQKIKTSKVYLAFVVAVCLMALFLVFLLMQRQADKNIFSVVRSLAEYNLRISKTCNNDLFRNQHYKFKKFIITDHGLGVMCTYNKYVYGVMFPSGIRFKMNERAWSAFKSRYSISEHDMSVTNGWFEAAESFGICSTEEMLK